MRLARFEVPVVLLAVRWVGRRPAGTVSSVTGGLRWPWLGRCVLVALPVLAAVVCGLVFAGVKAIEYTSLVQDGHTASVNDFYTYYFMFTGIHLGHVVLGMGALLVAMRISRPTATGTHRVASLEGVASFWHLVDLLWIMLFATLYLVR